ncbi:MAG: hypothetical protein NTW60_02930 [Candidatus Wolfebacteria bacterium]|nr:hypothetical protein [Candidatus Wolfebacteria bacterium]
MIISLYGSDTFLRNRKFKKIIEAYLVKNPSALIDKFDFSRAKPGNGADQEFERLKEFISNRSIFASKKMAVLSNVWTDENVLRGRGTKTKKDDSSSPAAKDFKKLLAPFFESKELTVVFLESKAPLAAFKFILEKPAEHEEFEELSGLKLKAFIKKEAEESGLLLSPDALDFLAYSFESNIWGLETELQKLLWLKPGSVLGLADVKMAGDYSESENLFEFTNSLGYPGNVRAKLYSLERLLFSGEDPRKIFNIFAAGRYLSPAMLLSAADYDVAVKSGKMDYGEVLTDLVLG